MSKTRASILIVDDEILSLQTLSRILGEEFDVRTATGAADAELILDQDWIQVVISDQPMPEMSGVEFLARVRERRPELVRMIISAYTDAEDIIDGINRAGIYQYITKPYSWPRTALPCLISSWRASSSGTRSAGGHPGHRALSPG